MTKIAFIGLGNMGGPMAGNLVKAGHSVKGFDLSAASCDAARAEGCVIAASAAEAVADADVLVTMLPAGKHVVSVWRDLAPKAKKGALFIDSSTIDVDSRPRGAQARRRGGAAERRCAGLGRHGRREGRDADLHVRRRRRGLRRRRSRSSRRWARRSSIAAATAPDRRRKSATT
jgi:6-phosphogluconate dehydrogenase (decarboxylating)